LILRFGLAGTRSRIADALWNVVLAQLCKGQSMKEMFVAIALALFLAASHANAQSGQTQPPSTPANQKVIKDPAEYNAYMTALNTTGPAAKGAAMEGFVKKYPQSVVLTDALEQAMAAYQQAGIAAKVEEVAKRLLDLMPNHIRALAIVVALDRAKVMSQHDQAALKEMCAHTETGLQQLPGWQKPEGMSDADFEKLRNQMSDIFDGASGFCNLQKRITLRRAPLTKKPFNSILRTSRMFTSWLWPTWNRIQSTATVFGIAAKLSNWPRAARTQ
jgi:hypothetical protein